MKKKELVDLIGVCNKFADNSQQLNVLRSATGFWMDGLVNFPIDIVGTGKGKKRNIFFFLLSIWHMVTKCTEFS